MERLKLKFRPEAFGDVVTKGLTVGDPATSDPFTTRLTAYVAEADTQIAALALNPPLVGRKLEDAEFFYSCFLAYSDQMDYLLQAWDTKDGGDVQWSRNNIKDRLDTLRGLRDTALGQFQVIVTPPEEVQISKRQNLSSMSVQVEAGF